MSRKSCNVDNWPFPYSCPMRWDELFTELEAEYHAALREETESEITEMVHAEAATIRFADRIRGRVGERLTVRLRNGETRQGRVNEANNVWSMLHEEHRRYLIPHSGVAYAWPLGGAAARIDGIAGRLTLGYALRALAGAGIEVRLVTEGGELLGRIGKVGADFCDLHTPTALITVPWAAILTVEA